MGRKTEAPEAETFLIPGRPGQGIDTAPRELDAEFRYLAENVLDNG